MEYIATLYTRHSSLDYPSGHTFIGITEEQYNAIKNEIENLEYLASEGALNYDLLDHDRDLNNFNCVTFAEHLLNTGNIKLGLIPHVTREAV